MPSRLQEIYFLVEIIIFASEEKGAWFVSVSGKMHVSPWGKLHWNTEARLLVGYFVHALDSVDRERRCKIGANHFLAVLIWSWISFKSQNISNAKNTWEVLLSHAISELSKGKIYEPEETEDLAMVQF